MAHDIVRVDVFSPDDFKKRDIPADSHHAVIRPVQQGQCFSAQLHSFYDFGEFLCLFKFAVQIIQAK